MNRREFMASSGLSTIGSCVTGSAPSSVNRSRPNIVVLFVDDMGWGDISAHGGPIETPNIDSLLSCELLEHVTYPICSASRAAALTGQHGYRNGLRENPEYGAQGLDNSAPTFAKALADYYPHRAWVGKWHLGYSTERHPHRFGFDYFYGCLGGGLHPYAWIDHTPPRGWRRAMMDNNVMVEPDGRMTTEAFTDAALDWIASVDGTGEPWLLNLSYTAPHVPFPGNWTYYEFLAHLDGEIGRFLSGVDRSNTFIWFASDHGAHINGDAGGTNYPFEGGKGSYLRGAINAVCAVNDPYRPMPSTIQHRTSNLDLLPTLKRVAGVMEDPGGYEFDCSPVSDGFDILSPIQRDIAFYEERELGRIQLGCLLTATHKLRVEIRPWSFEDNPEKVYQSWLSTVDDVPVNDFDLEAAMLQRLLDETPLALPYET